jgi:hypothetical protein
MKIKILIIFCGLLTFGAIYFSHYVLRLAQANSKTSAEAEMARLSDRFEEAYKFQPTSIAIWEGSNLISQINEDSSIGNSLQQSARMAYIHARMYALYQSRGNSNGMLFEASNTLNWVQKISPAVSITPENAVSNLLSKDNVIRVNKEVSPGKELN